MDIKPYMQGEYLNADEIEGLTPFERRVTIIGNARTKEVQSMRGDYEYLLIDVSYNKTGEVRPLRLGTKGKPNTACKSLKRIFGTETENWTGKIVELIPVKWGDNRFTVGVVPVPLEWEGGNENGL